MPNGPCSYAIAASAPPKGPVWLESTQSAGHCLDCSHRLRDALREDRAFFVFSGPLLTATLPMGPEGLALWQAGY
jgi:hypothetical protein